MNKNRDRIFREVLASVVSSKLRAGELRELADLLQFDRDFALKLGYTLKDVCRSFESERDLVWTSEEALSPGSDETLLDLAYGAIKRRRMSKQKVISLFKGVAPSMRWRMDPEATSVRDLVAEFFDRATTSQTQAFLSTLGMDVSSDPFLGGISSRSFK